MFDCARLSSLLSGGRNGFVTGTEPVAMRECLPPPTPAIDFYVFECMGVPFCRHLYMFIIYIWTVHCTSFYPFDTHHVAADYVLIAVFTCSVHWGVIAYFRSKIVGWGWSTVPSVAVSCSSHESNPRHNVWRTNLFSSCHVAPLKVLASRIHRGISRAHPFTGAGVICGRLPQ